jgi:hypothetical protein
MTDELKQAFIALRVKLMQMEPHLPTDIDRYADILTEIDRLCFHHHLSSAELELIWHEYELSQRVESALSMTLKSPDLPVHLLEDWLSETAPVSGNRTPAPLDFALPANSGTNNLNQSTDELSCLDQQLQIKPLKGVSESPKTPQPSPDELKGLDQLFQANSLKGAGESKTPTHSSQVDEQINQLFDL